MELLKCRLCENMDDPENFECACCQLIGDDRAVVEGCVNGDHWWICWDCLNDPDVNPE